jgi:hypothetical protein
LLLALGFFAPGEAAARLWNDARPSAEAVRNLATGIFDSELALSRLAAAKFIVTCGNEVCASIGWKGNSRRAET